MTYLNDLIDQAFKQRMSSLMARLERQTEALRILQDKRGVRIIRAPRSYEGFKDGAHRWSSDKVVQGRIEFAGHEWIPAAEHDLNMVSFRAYVEEHRDALRRPEAWKSREYDAIETKLREFYQGLDVRPSNTVAMLDTALESLRELLAEKLESPDLT